MSVLGSTEFWAFVGVVAGIYTLLGLCIQTQYGFGGLMMFGQAAYMAIAAYTMAVLVIDAQLNVWLAAVAAVGATMLFAVLTSAPAIRLRGDYLAIFTLASAEIVRHVATNADGLTGGAQGSIAIDSSGAGAQFDTGWRSFESHVASAIESIFGSAPSHDVTMLAIVWIVVAVASVPLALMLRAPWGRLVRAVRDDDAAAAGLGKRVTLVKLQLAAVGGVFGALAGMLFAFEFGFFVPDDFVPLTTLYAWACVILGGLGRLVAVPVGAVTFGVVYAGTRFFTFPPFSSLDAADRAYLRLVLVGALIIALVAFRPQGILGKKDEIALRRD